MMKFDIQVKKYFRFLDQCMYYCLLLQLLGNTLLLILLVKVKMLIWSPPKGHLRRILMESV